MTLIRESRVICVKGQFLQQESKQTFPENIKSRKRDYHFQTEVVHNNSDWPSLAGLPDGIPGLHVGTGAHKVTNFALEFIFGLHTYTYCNCFSMPAYPS